MGYTKEKGKIVIWTEKVFMADKYPFQDQGENHTFFFSNLKDRMHVVSCLSCLTDEEKKAVVSRKLNLKPDDFILKSKKSHYKQRK